MNPEAAPVELLYGLDDRPPWGKTLAYGLQWLIIFLPVLSLVAILAVNSMGVESAVPYLQKLFLVTGLGILAQSLIGHRLPLLEGPSTALIVTLATLAAAGGPVIAGGQILGGALLAAVGGLGLLRRFKELFSDRVVGVILLLISLTILPFLMPMLLGVSPELPAGRPPAMLLGLAIILGILIMNRFLRGFWHSLSIFLAVLAGTIGFSLLGWVDWSGLSVAPWFSPPDPMPDAWPSFRAPALAAFVIAYLAVLINAMGSVYSVAPLLAPDRIDRRLDRGLVLTGLLGVVAGGTGVVGTVPYSASPGMIVVTRVGTRYALTACGGFLVVMAFCGKLAALFSAIPHPVAAAALITTTAAQFGVGLEMTIRETGRFTARDYMVVGLPVLLGLGAAMAPPAFLQALPAMVRPLAGNGLIVGIVSVLLLEHLILPR